MLRMRKRGAGTSLPRDLDKGIVGYTLTRTQGEQRKLAYAAEGEHDYSNGTQITLVGTQETQGAQWTVTVPAKMQPGQTGTVKAEGTWAADQFIRVHAPETVTLTYGAQSMDVGISWANESCGFSKIGSNTDTVTHSVDVTVAEANRLFGEWTGILEYDVALIENGDVNRDGMITQDDALRITQRNDNPLTEEESLYADFNGSGDINAQDSLGISRTINGLCSPKAVNAVQPVETVLLGDVNNNGKINTTDAKKILNIISNEVIATDAELIAADANQDGVVSETDTILIQEWTTNASAPNTYISLADATVPTIEYYPNLVGDVNGNGEVDSGDVTGIDRLLAKTLTQELVDKIALVTADANGDKIVNSADADMIYAYVEGESVDGSIVGQYRQDVDNSEYTIEYTTTE